MSPDSTRRRVARAYEEVTRAPAPAPEADLIAGRLLDSLSLIELITELEHEFGVELPLETVECGAFNSIGRIAAQVDGLISRQEAVGLAPRT